MTGTCASCGFPLSDAPPAHQTSNHPDHLGRYYQVCDRCWHNPALFFLPREIEIHGSDLAVAESMWRKYHRIPEGQVTLFSVVPEVVRARIVEEGGKSCS